MSSKHSIEVKISIGGEEDRPAHVMANVPTPFSGLVIRDGFGKGVELSYEVNGETRACANLNGAHVIKLRKTLDNILDMRNLGD